jgi:hypothetical protein
VRGGIDSPTFSSSLEIAVMRIYDMVLTTVQ